MGGSLLPTYQQPYPLTQDEVLGHAWIPRSCGAALFGAEARLLVLPTLCARGRLAGEVGAGTHARWMVPFGGPEMEDVSSAASTAVMSWRQLSL